MSQLTLENIAVDVAGPDRQPLRILDGLSLELGSGSVSAIVGPSGAGKTTLMHVIAGLTRPTHGTIRWGSETISDFSEGQRDRWRRQNVGTVFQNFHLIDELSALDNILLPFTFDQFSIRTDQRAAAQALGVSMGLSNLPVRTQALSRGEQQRVAIARALIRKPRLLLADETTASLDAANAASVADLLLNAARGTGATLIIATHDQALLARIPRHLRIEAGHLQADTAS